MGPTQTAASLGLPGSETYDIEGVPRGLAPRKQLRVRASSTEGSVNTFPFVARIGTPQELVYYRHGGILPYVPRFLLAPASSW